MRKRKPAQPQRTAAMAAPSPAPAIQAGESSNVQAFSFGEPEPVIGGRSALMEYAECAQNGDSYDPTVSLAALARLLRVGAHHESALRCKVNILASTFIPTQWLSAADFKAMAFNFCVLGNGYLEWRENRLGDKLVLRHALAKYMRVGIEPGRFFFVTDLQSPHEFKSGSILHLREPDLHQEIYGVPGYLGAMQSAQLNESATLFRRRYYNNGSHAGFILYATDPAQSQGDIDALRKQLTQTKNDGNFRNGFFYAPGGKKDGLQLIGMLPNNTGGFGDVEKAATVFARNEITTLQSDIAGSINEQAGREVVRFKPYQLNEGQAGAPAHARRPSPHRTRRQSRTQPHRPATARAICMGKPPPAPRLVPSPRLAGTATAPCPTPGPPPAYPRCARSRPRRARSLNSSKSSRPPIRALYSTDDGA